MAKLSRDINTVKKDFNKIDKNEDGGVTDEEIKEFLVGRARAAGLSQKVSGMILFVNETAEYDANKEGKISKDNWTEIKT